MTLTNHATATRLLAEKDKEVERWHSAFDTAADQAMANGARALAAEAEVERLRDLLERALRFVDACASESELTPNDKAENPCDLATDIMQALAPERRP
jgi:hypothetical protein